MAILVAGERVVGCRVDLVTRKRRDKYSQAATLIGDDPAREAQEDADCELSRDAFVIRTSMPDGVEQDRAVAWIDEGLTLGKPVKTGCGLLFSDYTLDARMSTMTWLWVTECGNPKERYAFIFDEGWGDGTQNRHQGAAVVGIFKDDPSKASYAFVRFDNSDGFIQIGNKCYTWPR